MDDCLNAMGEFQFCDLEITHWKLPNPLVYLASCDRSAHQHGQTTPVLSCSWQSMMWLKITVKVAVKSGRA